MSNFDFLKSFNQELYDIGVKLEDDVLNSPRAVTADATLFLETIVNDMYRLSKKKLESHMISFYKKIDNLYRQGVISYIFKNKLQEAYNLRNKIHKNYKNTQEERNVAFDLHKRLYYISKKYFRDFCESERYIDIPDYKKPQHREFHFDNCIICGKPNEDASSNLCNICNGKIDNANLLLSIKNSFEDSGFTKRDLVNYGLDESEAISFLMELSKDNVIMKKGETYHINDEMFQRMMDEINEYIDISVLLMQFYNDRISAGEVKNTLEYWKGGVKQKNYCEFYRLVNLKLERDFEENLLKSENIKKSMKDSSMDDLNIREWFNHRKDEFIAGELNEAFIMYNELQIKSYFNYRKRNINEDKIRQKLELSDEMLEFWQTHFMSEDFMKMTNDIKKDLIIKEIKKNKSLKDALKSIGISQKEFDRIYYMSKKSGDGFHKTFDAEYTQKRQKTFIKHLGKSNLNSAIRISKITRDEFYRWYYTGEIDYSQFYMKTTKILMEKYLNYRQRGFSKPEILKRMNISKDMVKSWSKHTDMDLLLEFEEENAKITSSLIKRGKIINALKEDKSKEEAIYSAGVSPKEFLELYNSSRKERSNFHARFDQEYEENRKRLFPKLLIDNDFYNAIQKCEISQKEFNEWYIKDQDMYMSTNHPTQFYLKTTELLMEKYMKARYEGKNMPDAARSIGLSNTIVSKWLRHIEYDLFWDFKKKNDQLEIKLIIDGFKDLKSKQEVSDTYDIPLKTIEEFINLGKSGFEEFARISELYEDYVVPNLLKNFLMEFENKPYAKALKNSRITEEELNYYYKLGNYGNDKFKYFSEAYLNLKIHLFVKATIAKKSKRIAMKNANLTKEEYLEKEEKITRFVLGGRFKIIAEEISKRKTTGTKLAKKAGITLDEIYDWYLKGKDGDETFKDFALIFELGVLIPSILQYQCSLSIGIPKNWLNKQIKKEIGLGEFKIWEKYDILNQDIEYLNIQGAEGVDEEKLKSILKNSKFIKTYFREADTSIFDLIKSSINGNAKFAISPIKIVDDEGGS
ncbi:hypothetical protein [uncultured Methanobrevibacter sp.]|uniref:hypothetical protein n=1 Tax=uncultured Methanobrevibacter sp. TaxID=253161 RepID=UPI002625004C|nr:hypothetical protein [uncultured Methanobrevibacter sp.]